MDEKSIRKQLDRYCYGRSCLRCKIDKMMPDHLCGRGHVYYVVDPGDSAYIPIKEVKKAYNILCNPKDSIKYALQMKGKL